MFYYNIFILCKKIKYIFNNSFIIYLLIIEKIKMKAPLIYLPNFCSSVKD